MTLEYNALCSDVELKQMTEPYILVALDNPTNIFYPSFT